MKTPPFLAALGLDTDADERAIRRAYAQRLKAIDQETEPEAFQALHEAFEAAGRWVKSRPKPAAQQDTTPRDMPAPSSNPQPAPSTQDAQDQSGRQSEQAAPAVLAKPDPAPAPAPDAQDFLDPLSTPLPRHVPVTPPAANPRPAPPLPRPVAANQEAVAASVYKEFAERFAEESAEGRTTAESAKHVLEQTLNDARLLNLQARAEFERHIAGLLANGWRPGHHLLFDAAASVFHWQDDKQRLDALGDLGAYLNRALTEHTIFLNTSGAALKMRLRLVERLRNPQPPTEQEVSTHAKSIDTLIARYPNWLRLVTNLQNLELWRQGAQKLAAEIKVNKVEASKEAKRQAALGGLPLLAVIGFFGLMGLFKQDPAPQRPFPDFPVPEVRKPMPDNQVIMPPEPFSWAPMSTTGPGTGSSGAASHNPPMADRPARFATPPRPAVVSYNDKQIRQVIIKIRGNMHFRNTDQTVRNDPVSYAVVVNADGQITQLRKTGSSAVPAFDDAVSKAITQSQPFPKGTDPQTSSSFTIRATPRAETAGAPN